MGITEIRSGCLPQSLDIAISLPTVWQVEDDDWSVVLDSQTLAAQIEAQTGVSTEEKKEVQIEAPLGYSIEAAIGQIWRYGKDGERAVFYDTVTYISEHVWQQLIAEIPYTLHTNLNGRRYLVSSFAAKANEPAIHLFRNAVEARRQAGENSIVEEAEVSSFLAIEKACIEADKSGIAVSFLWFSPSGRMGDHNYETGRTFYGIYDPAIKELHEISLMDNFSDEDRRDMLKAFADNEDLVLENKIDLLRQPQFGSTEKFSNLGNIQIWIDKFLTNKYSQGGESVVFAYGKPIGELARFEATLEGNKPLQDLMFFLKDKIEIFIDHLKTENDIQELYREFRALTVYAKELLGDYYKFDGDMDKLKRVRSIEKELPKEEVYRQMKIMYQFMKTVVNSTSCPTAGNPFETYSMDPGRAYGYSETSPSGGFYCPKCHGDIPPGSGDACPHCGYTKQEHVRKTGVSCG